MARPRRVPVSLKPKLEQELGRLTKLGVISPVDQPTEWVSNMVVSQKKSGDLRICIDPKPLNAALKREHFQLPVLEDILPELAKAKVFTSIDLRSGYWHVLLDEESSKLTTFVTPFGRYRWRRLPFGISASSEIFQKKLIQAIGDITGVLSVADDIIVFGVGNDHSQAMQDHDQKLRKLLDRCRHFGIRLNKDKLKLRQQTIPFLGHVVTEHGLEPDPAKVTAVQTMPLPEDVMAVQRINGFVNYLAKFLPNLSDVMEPLRRLTRRDVKWEWTGEHDSAFRKIQQLVATAPVLRYYDPTKELTIQCDASQGGLGAALMQEGQPLAYASRALTDTERRYAQIEKEMLAIVFSIERFNQYTYGRPVNVQSDHKPLESILKKSLDNAPRRLQGMMMRLQRYDIKVSYLQGSHMYLADTLSRAYPSNDKTGDSFEHIHMTKYLPISEQRLHAIRQATEEDDTLQLLRQVVLEGWPEDKSDVPSLVMPYFSFRDEISIHDGLLFRGERVIIPLSMRSLMKLKLHSSHTGIDACLRRARECLFWPGMTSEISDYISSCSVCGTYSTSPAKETLMPHELPDRPWAKVGTDLFSLDNTEYLITVDYFSNFWEINQLESTSSKCVIRKLKGHFARYGCPDIVVSDNGPQFSSADFTRFALAWDFEHCPSSPGNSQGNGKAESAVKTAKRMLRKAKESGSDPFLALLDVRNTPSQNTGTSPAQKMMSRRTRTLLPTTKELLRPQSIDGQLTRKILKKDQDRQSFYYNRTAKDHPILEEDDVVRLKPFVKGKKQWLKGTVTQRMDERSYEVDTPSGSYRRNWVHLKKTTEEPPNASLRTPISETTTTIESPLSEPSEIPTQPSQPVHNEVQPERNIVQTPCVASPENHPISSTPGPVVTRSGRQVKPPARYTE